MIDWFWVSPFPDRDGEIADWAREKGAGLASAEHSAEEIRQIAAGLE